MNLLLIRGDFFIENIVADYEIIIKELCFLGYSSYVDEFKEFYAYAVEQKERNIQGLRIDYEMAREIIIKDMNSIEALSDF